LARKQEIGRLGKRLEAGEFDGIKAHERLKTGSCEFATAEPKNGFDMEF
jgi:hypothetical protein